MDETVKMLRGSFIGNASFVGIDYAFSPAIALAIIEA